VSKEANKKHMGSSTTILLDTNGCGELS